MSTVRTDDPRSLWKRYALALSGLVSVIVVSHLLEFYALNHSRHDAEIINLSGKQRMLSQQIVLQAKSYADGGNADASDRLRDTVSQFEDAHEMLLADAEKAKIIETTYFGQGQSLDVLVDEFVQRVQFLLTNPSDQAVLDDISRIGTGVLLEKLDDAVTSFEQASREKADFVHRVQNLTLFAAIAVIILEVLLIFRPAQKILVRSLSRLEDEVEEHARANARLSNFIDIASDLYWESDLKGRIHFIEGRFLDRIQWTKESLFGRHYSEVIQLTTEMAEKTRIAQENRAEYKNIDAEFLDVDGTAFVLRLTGKPRFSPTGLLLGYCGKADEVTSQVNRLGEVTRLSLTDPLTNVANKRAFERDLTMAIADSSDERPVTLLYLDLDRFKPINDTYGHHAGDEVLKIVASRIQSELRAGDWVARVGGDEFCVVCLNSQAVDAEQTISDRLLTKVSDPIKLSCGDEIQVGVSIGVADTLSHERSFSALCKAADGALYEAKRSGRNTSRIAAADHQMTHDSKSALQLS